MTDLWPAEQRQRERSIYLILRTSLATEYCVEEFNAFVEALAIWETEDLWFPIHTTDGVDDGEGWADGYLLRFSTDKPLEEFVAHAGDHLSWCASWAALDGDNFAEYPAPGPVSAFFDANPDISHAVLACWMAQDGERDLDELSGLVREAIGQGARSIAHFRDGRVVLVRAGMPMQQYGRRTEKLMRRIKHLAAVDTFTGSTFYMGAPRPDLWHSVWSDDD